MLKPFFLHRIVLVLSFIMVLADIPRSLWNLSCVLESSSSFRNTPSIPHPEHTFDQEILVRTVEGPPPFIPSDTVTWQHPQGLMRAFRNLLEDFPSLFPKLTFLLSPDRLCPLLNLYLWGPLLSEKAHGSDRIFSYFYNHDS